MRIFTLSILLFLTVALQAQEDAADYVVIGNIELEGNNITKPSVIFRELTFAQGDTLTMSEWQKAMKISRENLLNMTLFNFVDFEVKEDEELGNAIVLKINMIERWYLWPVPYFAYADRNLNSWYEADDITRLSYGIDLIHNNFFGRMHSLDLTVIGGYNQDFGLSYDIPYLNKKQHLGLAMSVGYTRDKEITYLTENDKVKYFNGGDDFAHQSFYASVEPYYRFGYRDRVFLKFGYHNRLFNDSLAILNKDFCNSKGTRFQYFTLSGIYKNDYRDDHNYPLNGHYLELELTKIGFGVFDNTPNLFYGKLTVDWYSHITGRWYWASNVTTKISDSNDPAYFISNGLGYSNDYVRSYELYVVDAMNFTVFKNNLKFNILKPVTRHLPIIRNERFSKIHYALYANIYFDFAYSWNVMDSPGSKLQNELLFGTGVGIDFVTYYDKVIRFEYGVNALGETGLFIHLVAPI